MSTRDMRQLIERIERIPGWSVRITRGGHYKITGPRGRLFFFGGTPSDRRSIRNARSTLRRAGVEL